MLISHKYKYAFIHVPKTAGSSITKFFVNNNYQLGLDKRGWWDGAKHIKTPRPEYPFLEPKLYRHGSWKDLHIYLLEEGYDPSEYFKFAFIRNPWDKMVSNYHYYLQFMTCKKNKNKDDIKKIQWAKDSFETWCTHSSEGVAYYQDSRIFYINNYENWLNSPKLKVDFVGKFENLESDIKKIIETICPHVQYDELEFPHINSTKRRPYQEYYSPKTIDIIRKYYKNTIELGNYEF
jgi:hypothetical protein